MKNILYLSAFALMAISVPACNENKRAKNYNEKSLVDDQGSAFIKEANEAGMTEIKSAMVAQSKSANSRVLGFAKMMVTDHTVAGNELKKIAESKFVNIKDAKDTLSVEHQQMITDMSKLSGPAFDKAYMQMMVTDHGKVIELFQSVTRNTNKALNNFAEKTLPKLQMHLDSAKAIYASLK
ncbi:DUF4142 domain-containing protein [Mucilaginibacter terrae]|uniref:DUF4142 domain-containing protein n=1 Tax=Mucilaginibacter terrae TaxID=1955052 RepID=UPI00362BC344